MLPQKLCTHSYFKDRTIVGFKTSDRNLHQHCITCIFVEVVLCCKNIVSMFWNRNQVNSYFFKQYIMDLIIVLQHTSYTTLYIHWMWPDPFLFDLSIVYGKPMFWYLLHTAFPPSEDVDPWEIISQRLKLKTQTARASYLHRSHAEGNI